MMSFALLKIKYLFVHNVALSILNHAQAFMTFTFTLQIGDRGMELGVLGAL